MQRHLSTFAALGLCAAISIPATAHAGAAQIMYQIKKQQLAAEGRQTAASGDTIMDVARASGMLTTFLSAVEAAGLSDTLRQPGPFTVFAPTDDAFAKIPKADLDALMKDRARLKEVLGYHVVPKKKQEWDLRRDALPTLSGNHLTVAQYSDPEDVRVQGVEVLELNIGAANGVIHVIDSVLMPPKG